ncbi:MAG: SDR family oxidoreductase [Pseudomonadota bacterium]
MGARSTVILGLGLEVGTAMAVRFQESGHKVLIADANEKRADKARAALSDDIDVVHANLHSHAGIDGCFVRALESVERLENLVLVPRIPKAERLADLDPKEFSKLLDQIVTGGALAIRLFTAWLMEQEQVAEARVDQSRHRGSVTIVLSNAVSSGLPGQFNVQVLQGAAQSLMRAAALELAEHGIRVNAVQALRPRAEKERWLDARTPLGRAALADEIADAAIYLSSRQAAIITGETLVLDGGRSLLSGLLRTVSETELSPLKED